MVDGGGRHLFFFVVVGGEFFFEYFFVAVGRRLQRFRQAPSRLRSLNSLVNITSVYRMITILVVICFGERDYVF